MMEEKTILIHPSGNEISFDLDHAKRLMSMSDNGGWKWKEEPKDDEPIPLENQNDHAVGNSTNQGNKRKTKK